LKALENKLRGLGFRCETPSTHEVNTLYDLPGQKLRRKGELLRLRKYGDSGSSRTRPRARPDGTSRAPSWRPP
jgi:adenylate cyclase class IV